MNDDVLVDTYHSASVKTCGYATHIMNTNVKDGLVNDSVSVLTHPLYHLYCTNARRE